MGLYSEVAMTEDKLIAGGSDDITAEGLTVLLGEGALARGSVLGKVDKGAAVGAAVAGNTGNPTFNAGSVLKRSKTKVGVYRLEVVELLGAVKAGVAAAVAGNTGNGVLTYTGVTQAAKVGTYRATCIAAALNGGTFELRDPDGISMGRIGVGVAFDGVIQVTIADGGADWVVGDAVTFTVLWDTDTSRLQVIDPDEVLLMDAFIGTAYVSDTIAFVLSEAAQNPVHCAIGDSWTITVAAGSGKYRLVNAGNTDGSQNPTRILCDAVDATAADVVTTGYLPKGGEWNERALVFGGADTIATHRDAMKAAGFVLRDSVPA